MRVFSRTGLALVIACCVTWSPARATMPVADSRLIRSCVSFYFDAYALHRPVPLDADHEQRREWLKAGREAAIAERKFKAFNPGRLRRKLTTLMASTMPGRSDNAGIAYVLAYNGIDFRANVNRILGVCAYTGHDPWLPEADDAQDALSSVLPALFRIGHDPYALDAMLSARLDGAYAEDMDDAVSELLADDTIGVLEIVSADKRSMDRVKDAVADGVVGPPHRLRRRLEYVAVRNHRLAEAARSILTVMARYGN